MLFLWLSILKAFATGHRELIFLKAHIHGIIGAMEVCAGLRERNSRDERNECSRWSFGF